MKSIDTNVLARFFLTEAPDLEAAERPFAVAVLASGYVFVTVTVLVEFYWLMRYTYNCQPPQILRILRTLASAAQVVLEDSAAVERAIDAYERGVDFDDAMHVARSQDVGAFVTFDRRLANRADRVTGAPVIELLRPGQ